MPTDEDHLPTGDVTFFFTDIEGSTRLVQRLGVDYARILDRHNQLMREAIARGGGTEFGTEGDAFFAAFPDAAGAVRAAVEVQQSLAREVWPEDGEVRVRIGLHTGKGRIGGGSYVGLDVHRAARIASTGHGGQVLLSEITAELNRPHLPPGVGLEDMGMHNLKDLEHPEHLYQLVIDGLPSEFPPLRARSERPLPVAVTELVGREVDLQSARDMLLRPGLRLLTITGPGGTGKTRLATELLHVVGTEFPDGVHYVDLTSVTDPALVLPAVGRALGIIDAEGREIALVAAGVVGAARVLVVLDNMEQVLQAGPDLGAILENTTNLKLLVTSREPLR
ncbi:MAG TPA: adenylate/guanylate cyclase domain-containing protein, partial [Acidimicrobiia bacterium]|nr:adenylate/guanylate cyclase domain-containing protein [Acidimicrobiia bacterium]